MQSFETCQITNTVTCHLTQSVHTQKNGSATGTLRDQLDSHSVQNLLLFKPIERIKGVPTKPTLVAILMVLLFPAFLCFRERLRGEGQQRASMDPDQLREPGPKGVPKEIQEGNILKPFCPRPSAKDQGIT